MDIEYYKKITNGSDFRGNMVSSSKVEEIILRVMPECSPLKACEDKLYRASRIKFILDSR